MWLSALVVGAVPVLLSPLVAWAMPSLSVADGIAGGVAAGVAVTLVFGWLGAARR